MVSVMASCLKLVFGTILVFIMPAHIDGTNVIKVPGLEVGSWIDVIYFAKDVSRAVLSVEDSIGKGLHLEVRYNEGCSGKEPEIVFNTKTNGIFDEREVISAPDLLQKHWYGWITVVAEENAYAIDILDGYKLHNFKCRSPHELSDVKKIALYKVKECSEDYKFNGFMRFGKIFSDFCKVKRITVRTRGFDFSSSYDTAMIRVLHRGIDDQSFKPIVLADVSLDGAVKFTLKQEAPTYNFKKPLVDTTEISYQLDHNGSQYVVTIQANDEIVKHEFTLLENEGSAKLYIYHYKEILELESELSEE